MDQNLNIEFTFQNWILRISGAFMRCHKQKFENVCEILCSRKIHQVDENLFSEKPFHPLNKILEA